MDIIGVPAAAGQINRQEAESWLSGLVDTNHLALVGLQFLNVDELIGETATGRLGRCASKTDELLDAVQDSMGCRLREEEKTANKADAHTNSSRLDEDSSNLGSPLGEQRSNEDKDIRDNGSKQLEQDELGITHAHSGNGIDESAAHNVVNDRNARIEHESIIDELFDNITGELCISRRLRNLGRHILQSAQLHRILSGVPYSLRRAHGSQSPRPCETHTEEQRELREDVHKDNGGGGHDVEQQGAEEGRDTNGLEDWVDEDEDRGGPGGHPAAEDELEVVDVEVIEP